MERQPHEVLWATSTAMVASRALHVVAELGAADHIGDDAVGTKELASRCGADPDALDRVLRLLTTQGIFEHTGDGYRHTPASQLLRSDHPLSMRAFPRMFGLPSFTGAFAHLEHAVRTGSPAVEQVDARGLWGYLEDHPDEAAVFGQAMAAKAAADIGAVLASYDFGRFRTIADIGGGRGHLLAALLEAVPGATGVLFDLPSVIDAVEVRAERLTRQAGDFFRDELPTADAYILMEVIHDWDDAQAVAILSAIRRAAPAGAVVLVIEGILDEPDADPRAHALDVVMLAMTGGRERTAASLGRLLDSSGFELRATIDTPGAMRIAEAVAV